MAEFTLAPSIRNGSYESVIDDIEYIAPMEDGNTYDATEVWQVSTNILDNDYDGYTHIFIIINKIEDPTVPNGIRMNLYKANDIVVAQFALADSLCDGLPDAGRNSGRLLTSMQVYPGIVRIQSSSNLLSARKEFGILTLTII